MFGLARMPASGVSLLLNAEGVFTALLADQCRKTVSDCFGELPRSSGCGLRPLYFETGHWHGDFVADRMTASGRDCEYVALPGSCPSS